MEVMNFLDENISTTFRLMSADTSFRVVFFAILGLLLGSFAGCITYRLPMEILSQYTKGKTKTFGHRSVCPFCNEVINLKHNIPLLSYFFLKGKSACCSKKIALRYPLIEVLMMFLFIFNSLVYQRWDQLLIVCILTFYAVSLAIIDKEHYLLPDKLTLTLLLLGMVVSILGIGVSLKNALLGGTIGFLSLWGVNYLYYIFKRKNGMGFGDIKYFSAIGTWVGIEYLFNVLLLSALLAISFTLICWLYSLKKHSNQEKSREHHFLARNSLKQDKVMQTIHSIKSEITPRKPINSIPVPFGIYLSMSFYICILLEYHQ